MAYYPQNATGLNYISYPVGPSAAGLTITASASANTKGSYGEVISSLPWTANAIQVTTMAGNNGTGGLGYLFDIATGAAASEVVIVPNIPTDTSNNSIFPGIGLWNYPVAITSGTRVAASCQCSTGSQTLQIGVTIIAAGGVSGITPFVNYGSNTTSSTCVSVDPGGVLNTKGAYAQITSSTSAVTQWLQLCITGARTAAAASALWAFDVATGAAASEVVLIPDVRLSVRCLDGSQLAAHNFRSTDMLTYISASTRIACRCSCASTTTSPARLVGAAIIAGTAPSEPASGGGGAWAFA